MTRSRRSANPAAYIPKYRLHRRSRQGVATFDSRDLYFGPHEAQSSRAAYDRLVAQWLANGRRLPAHERAADLTLNEVILRYWEHAKKHYRHPVSGEPTSELNTIKQALHLVSVRQPHPDEATKPKSHLRYRTLVCDVGVSEPNATI